MIFVVVVNYSYLGIFGAFELIFGQDSRSDRFLNLILMVLIGLVRSSLVYIWFENPWQRQFFWEKKGS